LWHLGVHDTASSGHELQITGLDGALVSCKVFVVYSTREQVCDGFLPTVGVIGEASTYNCQ
jgi:hypothetical protein